MAEYGLDFHCSLILEEYRENQPVFKKMQEIAANVIKEAIDSNGIYINALESRIKQEKSLAGKLELKGSKYATLSDLTDILGLRVITFYADEVDKVSALIERHFEVDWENSVDKRKMHQLDSFGYNSLHYICRIPKSTFCDPQMPLVNEYRFEIQMRTALQHVWATMYHDTGYKSGVEVPKEYLRNLNRLAGMLELADEQFSLIRTSINDYRRSVQNLVASGNFGEVPLDGDSFNSFLKLRPFDKLVKKIASINQAEIHDMTLLPYLEVFTYLRMETLKSLVDLIDNYSDDAYQLAVFQLGATDLDIVSSTIAVQNLCVAYILKNGGGIPGLKGMFDILSDRGDYNLDRAKRLYETALQINLIK